MPYNKFDIKVGNAASQKNLEEFILSIDDYLGELLEKIQKIEPDYNPSIKYDYDQQLTSTESAKIDWTLRHITNHDERVQWLGTYFESIKGYGKPKEYLEKWTAALEQEIAEFPYE
ncbi:hypothetical protein [Weissella cibaria]|uniref:hypothetical protein n=1 Tax=Weissella cibaria TaxID=137591 RepID=UPI00189E70FF|nr:hypothetical protein [Weissella cibaria]